MALADLISCFFFLFFFAPRLEKQKILAIFSKRSADEQRLTVIGRLNEDSSPYKTD